jgi:RNA polymerase sigma-70 factor (ECF subfamily)
MLQTAGRSEKRGMTHDSRQTTRLQNWLELYRDGDESALDELIRHASTRLEKLTRQMLRAHPAVRRWAETGDVLQGALLRLVRAVRQLRPASLRDFFALATQQVRRELVDLARHFYGPQGAGAHHASGAGENGEVEPVDLSHEGGVLAEWTELHGHIDALPEEEREVMGLVFYQGLTQEEAAQLLGVSVRTVQRRWHAALLSLHQVFKGEGPGE